MAGGVSAGRLSIELVAEVARLQQDLDKAKRAVTAASADIGRSAKSANDNLAGMGRGAQKMAGDVARLKAQLDPAWQSQQRYNQQVELGTRAFKSGAINREQFIAHMRRINTELKGVPAQMNAVTNSAGAQRAGMQQLGFQLQDFAVQTAGGTSATRAFAQQFPQAVGAMQLMFGQTSKLGAFLGGPWGVALGVAAAALVPLISKLYETEDAANAASSALQSLRQERLRALQDAALLGDTQKKYNELVQEEVRLTKEIARLSGGRTQTDGTPMFANAQYQQLLQVRREMVEVSRDYDFQLAKEMPTIREFTRAEEDRSDASRASERATRAVSAAERARIAELKALEREQKQAIETAESYAASLELQVRQYGLSTLEIRRMEVAAQAAAAPTAELAQRIRDAGAALDAKQIAAANDNFNDMVSAIYAELELLPLVGAEREQAALLLERESKMAEWAAAGLTDLNARWLTYAAARLAEIDAKSALERDLEAARALEQQLGALIGLLGRMQGFGGIFGDLAGVLTSGNPIASLLGLGGAGTLAGLALGGDQIGEQLTRDISKTLQDVFGVNGEFANTLASGLSSAFQGVATGSAVSGLVGGSSTGGQVGGLLGQFAGEELLGGVSGFIGKAAGPIGAIAGALLGSLLPKLLGGNEKGRATFSGAGFAISGDNNAREAAAGDLARAVIEAADRVADALGATGYSLNGTIGVRNDDIRFNPTGTSLKDGLNFGEDAAGAIKAAIANASFEGLSETFERLLSTGSDIDAQIQKALALQAAYDALGEATDPVAAKTDALNREFDALRSYLDEGNASAAERAKIEELYSLKLAEITEAATGAADASEIAEKRRELEIALLTAQGDILGAVAKQRQAELDQLDPSLHALQEQVWAAQELQATRALEIALMRAEGDEAAAVVAQRAIELSALTEAQRVLQERIYSLQDSAAAEAAAAAEAEAAARIAADQRQMEIRIMELTGDASGALEAQRAIELAALDASLRPFQMRINALEDEAAAAARAAAAAEELAATNKAIADQKQSLELRLAELQGDATTVLAIRRADELAATDASNRALLGLIYSLEDAKRAADEAAAAEAERTAELDRAAEAAAADAARIASQSADLEIRLARAQGDSIRELALTREQERAATDETLHSILNLIYGFEDAARIAEAAAEQADRAARTTAEAQAEAARLAEAQQALQIRILNLQGNTSAALALERQAEIDATDEALVSLITYIHTLEDAADAARDAAEAQDAARVLADKRIELELAALEAQGGASLALAFRRKFELDAMDESLRPLQQLVWTYQDAAAEAQRLADIEDARLGLEIRLYRALGNTAKATELERSRMLDSFDESLHWLVQAVWVAEDMAAAGGELSTSLDLTADRTRLQIRLLEAQGNASAALALSRQAELDSTDASLHALLQQVYTAEDAATAARELAEAQEAQARAAEEAARIAEQIARQQTALQVELLRATGQEGAALALERARTLADLDPSLHALQREVWDAQDALSAYDTALGDHERRLTDARGALSSAYEREAGALQQTIDRFEQFSASLRKFRDGLFTGSGAGGGYDRQRGEFLRTASMARGGDETALGGVEAAGSAFLQSALASAGSRAEYARDVSLVARAIDGVLATTDGAADNAQQQLDALRELVGGYIEINASVLSVAEAIEALEDVLAASPMVGTLDAPMPVVMTGGADAGGAAAAMSSARMDAIEAKLDRIAAAAERGAKAGEDSNELYFRPVFDPASLAWKTKEQT